jgi:hypothetical protein
MAGGSIYVNLYSITVYDDEGHPSRGFDCQNGRRYSPLVVEKPPIWQDWSIPLVGGVFVSRYIVTSYVNWHAVCLLLLLPTIFYNRAQTRPPYCGG